MRIIIEDPVDETKNVPVKNGSTVKIEFANDEYIEINTPSKDDDKDVVTVRCSSSFCIFPEYSNEIKLKVVRD